MSGLDVIDLLVPAFAQTLDDAVVATPLDDNTKPLPPPLVFDQGMVRRARVGVPQHLVGGWKDDRDAAGSRLWNGGTARHKDVPGGFRVYVSATERRWREGG